MEAVVLAGLIVFLVCALLLLQDNRQRKRRRRGLQRAREIDRTVATGSDGVRFPERRRGERRKINIPVAVERRVAERRGNPGYRVG